MKTDEEREVQKHSDRSLVREHWDNIKMRVFQAASRYGRRQRNEVEHKFNDGGKNERDC